jgi:site-specific recombinase XerD
LNILNCRSWCRFRELRGGGKQAQCQVVTNFAELTPVPSDRPVPVADPLRLAVAAYLARSRAAPAAVGRAIGQAIGARAGGPILLSSRGARMDRHAATRRLRRLAETAGVPITRPHPHMLRHTFVTATLDAGVDLRDVQIAARHAGPRTTMRYDRARQNPGRHQGASAAAAVR